MYAIVSCPQLALLDRVASAYVKNTISSLQPTGQGLGLLFPPQALHLEEVKRKIG